MSALTKYKINSLAKVLRDKNIVEFNHNEFYYEIFLSADSGFVVNLYSSDMRDSEGELIESNLVDGGLCESEEEKDAIEFML
jgi:hypothetical protein